MSDPYSIHVQTKPGVNLTEDDVLVHATRIDFTRGTENPVSSRHVALHFFVLSSLKDLGTHEYV